MPIYISRGRFTSDAVKGMLAKPENREDAVAKLFESVGGKLIAWYLTFGRHDWLRDGLLEEAELESTEFNDVYELQITREQDEARLRELFDPKTIVWLQDHPLRPHLELRAGFLVVYVRGHLDDPGRIVWLLDAAERLAGRVQDEIGESRTVGSTR